MNKSETRVIYVTRDIERALGMEPNADYLIVTNDTPYSEILKQKYPDFITLISSSTGDLLDTAELLEADQTRSLVNGQNKPAAILVFKNYNKVELIVKANDWHLLNPPVELAEKVENKISQIDWLGKDADVLLPKHRIVLAKDITWSNKPFVIQWAHGHTGSGTLLIQDKNDLEELKEKFPERQARVTEFIKGPSFTVNAIVTTDRILSGNISYQITGAAPFTDNIFTTIGNDWSLTHSLLSETEISTIAQIIEKIGRKLQKEKWLGLFGLDFIRDDERNQIYLVEINARQPASTTFESTLQKEIRQKGLHGPTTFEAHLASLLEQPLSEDLIPINDGGQIVQRITKLVMSVSEQTIQALEFAGYKAILYPNTEDNTDLLRIQSSRGLMENHNKFNARGKEIIDILGNNQ